MPFIKNDPKTIEAAKRGGLTGKKHFQKLSKAQQSKFGKRSGLRRQELKRVRDSEKDAIDAIQFEKKIMRNYLV